MDEIELLRELRAGLPGARADSRAIARARLVARIEFSQWSDPPRAALWRRTRLRLTAAGVILVALLVALAPGIFGGSGDVQPAVAQVLQKAARVAAAQEPMSPPGPDQYLFTRSRDAYVDAVSYGPGSSKDGHPWWRQPPL